MSAPEETTPWGSVGTKVAVQRGHGGVSLVTIARITKTQIITSDDARFRRDDGYQFARRGPWDPRDRLAHLHDKDVQDRLAAARLASLARRLEEVAKAGRRGVSPSRDEVIRAVRTMRIEIARAWDELGCNAADLEV